MGQARQNPIQRNVITAWFYYKRLQNGGALNFVQFFLDYSVESNNETVWQQQWELMFFVREQYSFHTGLGFVSLGPFHCA